MSIRGQDDDGGCRFRSTQPLGVAHSWAAHILGGAALSGLRSKQL